MENNDVPMITHNYNNSNKLCVKSCENLYDCKEYKLDHFCYKEDNKKNQIIMNKRRKIWDYAKVSNKSDIKIYDNILSNEIIKIIQKFCKEGSFSISHKSMPINRIKELKSGQLYKGIENRYPNICLHFHKLDVISNKYFYDLFYDQMLPNLDCIDRKEDIIIDRMYFNTHIHGISGIFHKDGKTFLNSDNHKEIAPSVLLYINNNWNVQYDGSTCFILDDNNDKNIHHVEIKQGRIVVFPSYISHKACDTNFYSHINNTLRYVIAFHCMYKIK